MRVVLVLSLVATIAMLFGPQDPFWLYLGRFLAGVASGAAFRAAPGCASCRPGPLPGPGRVGPRSP